MDKCTGFRGIQNKPLNRPGDVLYVECPACHSQRGQIRIGRMPSGSQRYKCKSCGKKYTPMGSSWTLEVQPSGLVK